MPGAQILLRQLPGGEAGGTHSVKLSSGPDDGKIVAPKGRGRRLYHRQRNGDGHTGVNGVSTLFQDLNPGRGCQRMRRGHHGIRGIEVSPPGRKAIRIGVVAYHRSPLLIGIIFMLYGLGPVVKKKLRATCLAFRRVLQVFSREQAFILPAPTECAKLRNRIVPSLGWGRRQA